MRLVTETQVSVITTDYPTQQTDRKRKTDRPDIKKTIFIPTDDYIVKTTVKLSKEAD